MKINDECYRSTVSCLLVTFCYGRKIDESSFLMLANFPDESTGRKQCGKQIFCWTHTHISIHTHGSVLRWKFMLISPLPPASHGKWPSLTCELLSLLRFSALTLAWETRKTSSWNEKREKKKKNVSLISSPSGAARSFRNLWIDFDHSSDPDRAQKGKKFRN